MSKPMIVNLPTANGSHNSTST